MNRLGPFMGTAATDERTPYMLDFALPISFHRERSLRYAAYHLGQAHEAFAAGDAREVERALDLAAGYFDTAARYKTMIEAYGDVP